MLHKSPKTLWLILPLLFSSCSKGPITYWSELNEKAKHLSRLDHEYDALKKEHEKLKEEYFSLENEYAALEAKVRSKELAETSLKAAGTKSGRTIASISYQVPKGLSAEETLNLAFEHIREERFAQAAVTFDYLLSSPEGAAYQKANVFYAAGLAWYQVNNYYKAQEQFEQAKEHAEGEERERIRRKVDLWMRVIDRRLASVPSAEESSLELYQQNQKTESHQGGATHEAHGGH